MFTSEAFDCNLFAIHDLPFAAYAEPEGYARLSALTAVQSHHYETHVPLTTAAARDLLASVTQRDEWGQQYVVRQPDGSEEGEWRTETIAQTYATGGKHERRGDSLDERMVQRTLTRTGRETKRGNGVYALGRTDKHLSKLELGLWRNGEFRTTPVSVLLLDIDMDTAWERQEIAPIRRELAIEREIAVALRLPYRIFRTGNRGHQIVLPLPAQIDRSVAGWLLDAYVELLTPYHFQGGGAAKADSHNLSGLVRIAGGRHANTERVAFWVDPQDASLFPIPQQLELMRTGYQHPSVHPQEVEAFAEAAAEISAFLESKSFSFPHEYATSRLRRTLAFAAVIEGLPENLFVERFLAAQEMLALPDEDQLWEDVDMEGAIKALEAVEMLAAEREESGKPHARRLAAPADEGSRAWAERVWAEDWPATGAFWMWISEGGRRGITAAKRLFGEERAEQELLARVDAHPISRTMPGKARERKRVISALYPKHRMTGFGVARRLAGVVLPEAAVALVPVILERLHAVKPIQPRNRDDIERLVAVLLIAFTADVANERRGVVDLSLDDLVSIMRSRWPETGVNRDQIRRYLRRLTDGVEGCAFSLIGRAGDNRGWTKAARYRPGPDLRVTEWGRSLPTDTHQPQLLAPLRVEPLRYRVQGGTHVFEAPKKRGRRPHSGSADPGEAV